MPIEILMPALSPTMTEGNITIWHKKEGDVVSSGEIIAEIETDKATMEVEAVDEGILGKILIPEGSEGVQVNTVIGLILADGEDAASMEKELANSVEAISTEIIAEEGVVSLSDPSHKNLATPLARRIAEQEGIDLASINGTGAHGKITRVDVQRLVNKNDSLQGGISNFVGEKQIGDRKFSSPLARHMASEAGLSLESISGTGPGGRVLKADVLNAQFLKEPMGFPNKIEGSAVSTKLSAPGDEDYELVPMSRMRKVVAERMVHSKSTVPHFYLTVDCEIDELLKIQEQLNQRMEKDKLSVNDFVIRACALALMEVPEGNLCWHGDGMIRKYKTADISIAVALDEGLITPIICHAEQKGLVEISSEMRDLASRARGGKLLPAEFQGGSFSISNLGMFGIKQFDAVINEPQGAILAVGAGEQRPVAKKNEVAIATVMSCTLSCDHRVIDGAIGARLLGSIKRFIEYPPIMLL